MNTKFFLTLCCFIVLGSCASKKTKADAEPKKWNYDEIRKARAAEQEQLALTPPPQGPEKTLDCVMMSAVQKKQARASGCRKMDARLGYGADTYCCDRE